jgi:hypothetical protein
MARPSTWKNAFSLFQLWKFWATLFGGRFNPPRLGTPLQSILPLPSGHQTTAMFSRHDIFLPLFSPQLRPRFAVFNRSPEGWDKNTGEDRGRIGGFSKHKAPLGRGGTLQHPAPIADASNSHLRGFMQQKSGDYWHCGFFFKKLTDTESRYSTFDQELLAVYLSIRHFCQFFEGHPFQLWTDQTPLVTALFEVTAPILPSQQCLLALISELNV